MDAICLFGMSAIGIVALAACYKLREQADRADERRGRTVAVLDAIVTATGCAEPTRPDANDPFKTRFLFCGRWTEKGHGERCPWQAALARTGR
jgi:hypothetical protein